VGQPVIVDNRAGGGVAGEFVSRAEVRIARVPFKGVFYGWCFLRKVS
jgi:hypothetical protein